MNQIASKGQLRMSLLRWILFIVPITVLLGFTFSQFANSGEENRWFQALVKPTAQPPGWVFGAPLRVPAIILYLVQFTLNLFWPILFFGMHQVVAAFWLLVIIFMLALGTTLVFGRIRKAAAWLLVPYLAWLCFAAILNKQIDWLNPGAETLVVPAARSQI